MSFKCDQQKQGIATDLSKLDEYCRDHGFAGWFETSAKDNVNIEESAKGLVNKVTNLFCPESAQITNSPSIFRFY